MRKRRFFGALIFAVPVVVAAATFAVAGDGAKSQFKADTLTGYQEAATAGSISTPATGTFEVSIDDNAQTLSYTLTYSGLSTPATQAHIHFGNRVQNGGIAVFLCGGGPHPVTCPPGTTSERSSRAPESTGRFGIQTGPVKTIAMSPAARVAREDGRKADPSPRGRSRGRATA